MRALIGTVCGIAFVLVLDWLLIKKYGYPSLSFLIAACLKSKWLKWLAFDLWGDDSLYYGKVLKVMSGSK